MGHQHSGNYSAKHPPGTQVPDALIEAIKGGIRKGAITCTRAHAIAEDLGVTPQQVGVGIDLIDARIMACQLGLFGKDEASRNDKPATPVEMTELEQAIKAALTNNRLTCIQAWNIGADLDLARPVVGRACDAMGVKIGPCQLGAF